VVSSEYCALPPTIPAETLAPHVDYGPQHENVPVWPSQLRSRHVGLDVPQAVQGVELRNLRVRRPIACSQRISVAGHWSRSTWVLPTHKDLLYPEWLRDLAQAMSRKALTASLAKQVATVLQGARPPDQPVIEESIVHSR
jgi:hypothetical protein